MIRTFLFLLIGSIVAVRASNPITAPMQGASASVSQPHVVAELIPETTHAQPGQPFDVALHLHMDPDWHTYWINPGDAGLATTLKWTLPPGFTAGPIQWPTPEKHDMGGLMTFGYAGDVYLLTTITPPKSGMPPHFDIKAKAEWLVCKEECIPGHGDLTLTFGSGAPVENKDFFAQARERLPVPNTLWTVSGDYTATGERSGAPDSGRAVFEMGFESKAGNSPSKLTDVYFFPEQPNVLSPKDPELHEGNPSSEGFLLVLDLIQNGETPNRLSGVLVADNSLIGSSKAVYISNVTILNGHRTSANTQPEAAAVPGGSSAAPASPVAVAGPATVPSSNTNFANSVAGPATATSEGTTAPPPGTAAATPEAPPLLIAVMGAAFIGGMILNLMPCVLPVLSLKVFSLMKHAGENPRAAWIQGVAFTAGVVLSFWVLAGLLIALRAAGNQIGWGFQMQSPGFVLALIFLFFLLALNLFGVFELGASLVGLDAKTTGHWGGLASSFGNGALATLAATPCTAPFMGSALGFAAEQPALISLLIFTFLALGMATPYLLLTIFPGALRFVPKPGAWMEAFKQFMGFLLMATVIFLTYSFGALVGSDQVPLLLFLLLLTGLVTWIYGRWGGFRALLTVLALSLIYCAVEVGLFTGDWRPISEIQFPLSLKIATAQTEDKNWQPWTPAAVDAALAQNRPVFIDFTAAWCLSCKVNERLALDTDAVKQAFAKKNVELFRADWTHSDPAITKTLEEYHRDGVPLYLLYSPAKKDAPQVLPPVLTPGIVLEALDRS